MLKQKYWLNSNSSQKYVFSYFYLWPGLLIVIPLLKGEMYVHLWILAELESENHKFNSQSLSILKNTSRRTANEPVPRKLQDDVGILADVALCFTATSRGLPEESL